MELAHNIQHAKDGLFKVGNEISVCRNREIVSLTEQLSTFEEIPSSGKLGAGAAQLV
jgi:hypothetical protein